MADTNTPDGAQAQPADERVAALIAECRRLYSLKARVRSGEVETFPLNPEQSQANIDEAFSAALDRLAAAPPAVVPAEALPPGYAVMSLAATPASAAPVLTEQMLVSAAGWDRSISFADILYGYACQVGPMPTLKHAQPIVQRMWQLAAARAIEVANKALASKAAAPQEKRDA